MISYHVIKGAIGSETGKMTGGMLPLYIGERWQNMALTLCVRACMRVVYIVMSCMISFCQMFPLNGQHTYILQCIERLSGFTFFHFKRAICPLIGENIGTLSHWMRKVWNKSDLLE